MELRSSHLEDNSKPGLSRSLRRALVQALTYFIKKVQDVSREFDKFLVNTHLCKLRCWYLYICNCIYKGPAPRASNAARYARARKNTTKCEGGKTERRGQRFSASSDLIMSRVALYTKLISLCCALCACWRCHVLNASIDVIFEYRKGGPRDDNQMKKMKKDVYTRTYTGRYRLSHNTWYCGMFERKHSAAQHRRARHGTVRHHTGLRC